VASIPRATGSRFFLELDGQACGFLDSVDGGDVVGEVVAEGAGGEHFVKKHLGQVAPRPIAMRFGLGLAPALYAWMADAWAGKQAARSGRIVFVDSTLQLVREVAFESATITSVTFPKLDASSKEALLFGVVLDLEAARPQKGSGKLSAASPKLKQASASGFRVEIDGLNGDRAVSVDSFTVEIADGAPIDFPGLRITLSETGAETWQRWHEDFVVEGKNDDGMEKSGALVLLDPAMKPIGRVTLAGLGIRRLSFPAPEGTEAVARVVAELYCEQMGLEL
jgi:T4-like virus tail tube protein gp19